MARKCLGGVLTVGAGAVSVAALLSICAWADDVPMPAEFGPVRALIEEAIAKGASPSLALAVVKGDRVVWAEGFGWADLERKIRATSNSIYLLASVSKPITATGLMVLVDRGLVDLDRPANEYLPGSKLRAHVGSPDEMTIRRLANHTAGLPIHYNFYHDGATPLPWDETIRRYGFAACAPGSRWEYSNLAFGLLGYITEVVSRRPWGEMLENEVFDPIDMVRTSDRVRPGREADATVRYAADAAGRFVRVEPYGFDHPGASALWSSASDLGRFLRLNLSDGALEGSRVLSAASARAMRQATSRNSAGIGTGVGWAVGEHLGRPCFWHSGGMPGVSTILRGYPEDGIGVVALANTPGGLTTEVADRIAKVLLSQRPPEVPARDPRAGESSAVSREAAGSPSADEDSHAPAEDLPGIWEGRLEHFDGAVAVKLIVEREGAVIVSFNGRTLGRLRDVRRSPNGLVGHIPALIRTQQGFHGIPELEFRLERDGRRMTGIAVALAEGYFALSHWLELEKKGGVRV